jgi:hypothetical protein
MPYIGKSPVGGGFHKLDNLTASATATYALTLSSAAYYPETANQLLVSLNGVIQAPQDSFTVSGSNLIFDSALTASDSIDFVVALGDVLGVQGVTDGAVTTNKIANGAVTKAKMGTTELDLATIKDSTGTTTAMTIDSAGRVLMPSLPSFYVDDLSFGARGSGVTYGTGGNVRENTGNCYAVGTGRFTASVTGRYFISASIQSYDTVQTTDYNAMSIFKNGSIYGAEMYQGVSSGSENYHTQVYWNGVVPLAVNDYLQVRAEFGARDIQSFFTGYLIG